MLSLFPWSSGSGNTEPLCVFLFHFFCVFFLFCFINAIFFPFLSVMTPFCLYVLSF